MTMPKEFAAFEIRRTGQSGGSLTNGLIHHWDLESDYDDDVGGTAWTLDAQGGASFVAGGTDSKNVADFSSGQYADRYVAGWDGTSDEKYTISVWIQPTTIDSTNQYYFSWGDDLSDPNDGIIFQRIRDSQHLSWVMDAADASALPSWNTTNTAATWYHVVQTVDMNADEHKLYVNGTLLDTNTTALSSIKTGTFPRSLDIGHDPAKCGHSTGATTMTGVQWDMNSNGAT